MSTTWAFIGLLSGREIALSLRGSGKRSVSKSALLVIKDLGILLFGLGVSFLLAALSNPVSLGGHHAQINEKTFLEKGIEHEKKSSKYWIQLGQ
jgi:hypothetical protein